MRLRGQRLDQMTPADFEAMERRIEERELDRYLEEHEEEPPHERDRHPPRPLGPPPIIPPDGGEPVAYTRVSTLAKALDDLNNLMAWKARKTAEGLVRRPDLLTRVAGAIANGDPDTDWPTKKRPQQHRQAKPPRPPAHHVAHRPAPGSTPSPRPSTAATSRCSCPRPTSPAWTTTARHRWPTSRSTSNCSSSTTPSARPARSTACCTLPRRPGRRVADLKSGKSRGRLPVLHDRPDRHLRQRPPLRPRDGRTVAAPRRPRPDHRPAHPPAAVAVAARSSRSTSRSAGKPRSCATKVREFRALKADDLIRRVDNWEVPA